MEGISEGLFDGFKDGILEGKVDGKEEGLTEGILLGINVGIAVGIVDGIKVGHSVVLIFDTLTVSYLQQSDCPITPLLLTSVSDLPLYATHSPLILSYSIPSYASCANAIIPQFVKNVLSLHDVSLGASSSVPLNSP